MEDNIIQQYKIISDDLRYFSDQRFKIISVFILINGFLINFIKDKDSVIVGLVGAFLAVMCMFWDIKTKIWWQTLVEQAKKIENKKANGLIKVYLKYNSQSKPSGFDKIAFCRPSTIIISIYIFGLTLWVGYIVNILFIEINLRFF